MDVGHVITVVLVSLAMHLFTALSARCYVPELSISIWGIALNLYRAKLHMGAGSMYT